MSVDLVRSDVNMQPFFDRFILKEKLFTRQFNSYYKNRLQALRPHLIKIAKLKWGANVKIYPQLIDSEPGSPESVVLIANIFKELKLRPSVLEEYRDAAGMSEVLEPLDAAYFSSDDKIFLEDESDRIMLVDWSVMAKRLVTGVTLAVKGKVQEGGEFAVQDFCSLHNFENVPPSVSSGPRPLTSSPSDSSRFLLFLSGMEFGGALVTPAGTPPLELSAQMLADFVGGRVGGERAVQAASKIVRIIVAGNSMARTSAQLSAEKHLSAQQLAEINAPSRQLLGTCPVDVLPGLTDPSNDSYPQQPLNQCLLPHATRFSSYTAAPNPYHADIGGIGVLGHSGEPVDDIRRQTSNGNEMGQLDAADVLVSTLCWGHLCPTAPDTIPAYPFTDTDPFVLSPENSTMPTIFFCGNQDEYSSRLVQVDAVHTVRLLCLPRFCTSREAILLDMDSLECEVLRFGVN